LRRGSNLEGSNYPGLKKDLMKSFQPIPAARYILTEKR
jgi:hypothetical protein